MSLRFAKLGQLTPELPQTINPHTNILLALHLWSMTFTTYITIYYLNLDLLTVVQFHSLSYSLLNIVVVLLLAHVLLSPVRINVVSLGWTMPSHGDTLLFIQPCI